MPKLVIAQLPKVEWLQKKFFRSVLGFPSSKNRIIVVFLDPPIDRNQLCPFVQHYSSY